MVVPGRNAASPPAIRSGQPRTSRWSSSSIRRRLARHQHTVRARGMAAGGGGDPDLNPIVCPGIMRDSPFLVRPRFLVQS